MGKIGSGCDIVFMINGDYENAIRMGSSISSEQVSYRAVAQTLMNEIGKKEQLKNALKLQTRTKQVTLEDINRNGITNNCTVADIAKMYSDRDWSDVDQSTKILATDWFQYYGQDFNNMIIKQNGGTIIVVDPSDKDQIDTLYNYLKTRSKLRQLSDDTRSIIQQSKIGNIVQQLPDIVKSIANVSDEIAKIEEKAEKQELSKYYRDKLAKLRNQQENYEKLTKNTPKDAVSLLYDYLDDSMKYFGLSYKDGNKTKSVTTELENIINTLLGKTVREYTYNDVFANEVSGRATYNFRTGLSAITKHDFIEALNVKLSDLNEKINSMSSYGEEGETKKQLTVLRNTINSFLKKQSKSGKDWNNIINILIDQTDDEFSYSLQEMDDTYIYLKNVPMLLEDRYDDFTYKSIEVMKPVETYKDHTIYVDPTGEKYYFSRHILTTKSYGKAYKTVDECKNRIDLSIFNNPINQQSLIEFKYKTNDAVWLPNRFIPGQVIKVLYNPKWNFSAYQHLNEYEQNLIYDTGIKNGNTLKAFYKYIADITDFNTEIIMNSLKKYIDTAEKAVCFIYELNQELGTTRGKITHEQFNNILNTIKETTYKYYVVEDVSGPYKGGQKKGFKQYRKNTGDNVLEKGTYKTIVTEVQPAEITNQVVQYDSNSGRLMPTIRLLRDLAKKIQDKLGVTIHIETQSTLEDLFKEWDEEMPSQVNGFIKNGEIYINSSVASTDTLLHEFTHIMLGVLKAKNFDNYYELVNLVGNHERAKYKKKQLVKLYPNRAESDINEEVFADLFAASLIGKDLGEFLNGTMEGARRAVDDKMGSIFGKEKLSEDFYNGKLSDIFQQFGYDLGELTKQGNGLEVNESSYREASNWIEQQIAEHRDNDNVGILEQCE